jgi:SAM-dependent methyltransferase
MSWSYDAIAEVYATDMGASMPFDDVGFYIALCQRRGGTALELGCGTGRILLPLLAAGIDAFGVDRSLPMLVRLQRDAAARGLSAARVAQMDLRTLALHGAFATVLAPYSLVTYLTQPHDLAQFLAAARGLLAPDGVLVLDAFVPRDVTAFDDFRLDYRRAHDGGTLERHKRIALRGDGCNTIERRYRVYDAGAVLREEFTTCETIRPYRAETLRAAAAAAKLSCREETLDYGASPHPADARFATLQFVAA